MRGDPWHREPPLGALTVDEVLELGSALHDCWVDIEGLTWERTGEKQRIVSFRLPLALDEDERKLPATQWELVVRNPSSIAIEDTALISQYCLNTVEAMEDQVVIDAFPLIVRIGVRELDVAVERRQD